MLCDNLEGWDEERGGREAQGRGVIDISMADSCGCMVETISIL